MFVYIVVMLLLYEQLTVHYVHSLLIGAFHYCPPHPRPGPQVLALSVREALQQTLVSLRAGQSTTGMDVGLHGGHSTDGEALTERPLTSACQC